MISTLFSDGLQQLIQDISQRRAEIKEDFVKLYLSEIKGPLDESVFDKIELVEHWSEDRRTVRWYFREKK